jgi:hypothetical protein
VAEMSAIENWAVFLAKANVPEYRDVIQEIINRKEGISVAYEMLTAISKDENERARFHSCRMWQFDRQHELASVIYDTKEEYETLIANIITENDKALEEKDKALAYKGRSNRGIT